jgi:serine/threonine-protein kinase Chk1
MLRHCNIIKYLGLAQAPTCWYIFLELGGGELFDRIEPDRGVVPDVAHFYLSQLISAIGYIHQKGVAHRDIKPENIL